MNHKAVDKQPISQLELLDSITPIHEEKELDNTIIDDDKSFKDDEELEYNYTNYTSKNITRNETNKWNDDVEKDEKGDDKEDIDEESPTNNTSKDQPNNIINENPNNATKIENQKMNSFDEELFKKLESKIESLNQKIEKLSKIEKETKEPPIEKVLINKETNSTLNISNKTNNTSDTNTTITNSTKTKDDDLVDNNNSILKMLFKQKENNLDVQIYNLSEDIYRNFLIK
jgi:hypothetical protein